MFTRFFYIFYFLKKLFNTIIYCLWELELIRRLKYAPIRNFQRDWILTKKFFLKTGGIFFFLLYLFNLRNIFNIFFNNQFLFKYFNLLESNYYWIGNLFFLIRQFIAVNCHQIWFIELWFLKYSPYLLYYWVAYDNTDRRRRWGKFFAFLACSNNVSLKYYMPKKTTWKNES